MKKGLFLRRFLLFAFILIVNGQVFAQNGIFDRAGIIPGHGSYSSVPEESVDLFTGNVTLRYLDYRLPGLNGLDLEIWRVYNSKFSPQAEPKSWIGVGWTMHMGRVHNYGTTTPVIEFPDGRRETAYPDNYPGIEKNITRDFLKYDRATYKLYFQDGVIWTFGVARTITKGDGSTESVRLVTKIENSYGHSINIAYDSLWPSINYITDSMGRIIDFVSTGTTYRKLSQMKVKNAKGDEVVYNYTVSEFPNGYHKLTSFAPPLIPATTFEYNDGANNCYELTKVTTSYGGALEFSYVNHDFYFINTCLDSRVASQKKITFNPGEQAIWNYTYPSYNGVPTGTATVEGPEFTTSVTSHAYDASCPWKIGLISSQSASDGSYSESFDWTFQEISDSTWSVLGTNMGTAKGPLLSSVIRTPLGDATSKEEYLYERTETKMYGLPTKVKYYVNGAGSPKSYKDIAYKFEESEYFLYKYMLLCPILEKQYSGGGTLIKETQTAYSDWGAVTSVRKLKAPGVYSEWLCQIYFSDPKLFTTVVDPPGYGTENKTTTQYSYGVPIKVDGLEEEIEVTGTISQYDSSITVEAILGLTKQYTYDNLGRVTLVDMLEGYNDIGYAWRPNGENKVVIT